MKIDTRFRQRYTTIPFAVYSKLHTPTPHSPNTITLTHYHKEMELFLITDGSALLYVDSVAYEVQKGDIFVIAPYHPHNAKIFSDRNFSHHCICFDLQMIYERNLCEDLEKGNLTITPHIPHTEPCAELLGEYVKKACQAHSISKAGWELNVIGYMSLFLGLLKEHCYIQQISDGTKSNDFSIRLIDYISKNYSNGITSRDAADFLHISNSYFCRIFKENFGSCFQNYLNVYRLEAAKEQLKTSTLTITEISVAVGFNSFSYFSKLFKDAYNCTPTEYRKLSQKYNEYYT